MLLRIGVALLLLTGGADAARFRGYLGADARVTLTARATLDGTWAGRFRCRGRECPIKRGQVEWYCSFDTFVFGVAAGGQGSFDFFGHCDGNAGLINGHFYADRDDGVLVFFRVH